MKKIISNVVLVVLLFSIVGCSKSSDENPPVKSAEVEEVATRIIVDHAGNEVEIPAEINRVATMSIFPFTSTLAMYLGSGEKIVGMHPVSKAAAKNGVLADMYPEVLNAKSNYMTGLDLNIEELINLEPDVVFYNSGKKEMYETLVESGITAIGVSATSFGFDCVKTYDEWIKLLNQVFPEDGQAVMKTIDYGHKVYDEIQNIVADIPAEERKRAMFLFQYDDKVMVTSGKKFFGQYWIDAAGGINVAEGMQEVASKAKISMEQVYEWDPDIIYITNFTGTQPEDLYNNAIGGDDWSEIKAVKEKQVYKMPLGTYRSFTPTADTPLTLMWMAKTMYPDLFTDIDMNSEVIDYFNDFFDYQVTDEQIQTIFNPDRDAAALGNLN